MTCPETITFELARLTEDWPDGSQDTGWAVFVKTPDGDLCLRGDEYSSIGFETADDAIDAVCKWCLGRGYHEPNIMFDLTARRVQ